ncbi:hypothetical protein BDB00DRAFT_818915 [Zychaea mexicana]|uniref:uncharacterized protein n=1 Tax=Zychaea mexicana TaxID=64656 RepID=UPI0022FEB8C3|nr:uncharacterized protein BDB00DRAFT_818915 [Zychaea mexicana]KAI9494373.1 hypothetical protein BDB00DRAFT_818915 [Zychaea mexicana]
MDDYLANQGIALQDGVLVATKHIEPGTTVLQQQALASVPLPTIRGQRCNYCLRKAALQCCSRCRSAYFCSNECFRNAWLQFHRVLCEPQEYDIYVDVDADRWLLERAALTLHSHNRLSKHHSHSPPHLPLAIDALHSLSSPPSSPKKQASPPPTPSTPISADNNDSSNTTASSSSSPQPQPTSSSSSLSPKEVDLDAVAQSLEPFGCHYTKDELEDLWKKVQKSTFEIVDHDQYLDTIALGVYPITSLYVRHSCRPNTGAVYKRGVQLLVALDDIAAGEPITLSYVDLLESKAERMQQLTQRFGPDYACHCARCTGDYAILDQLLDASPESRPGYDEAELERQCQTWNVLNMVKAYQTIATPRVLDASNYTHYTSRIMAPDIYAPVTTPRHHHHHHSNEDLHFLGKESKVMTARRVVPAQVPSVPAFTLQSLRAARNESRWVEASRCALYLFVTYRLVYPTLHPTFLIVARSAWNSLLAGIGRKLERIYENGVPVARESVYHTFGQETNLWREIWVFERDQKLK